MKFDEVKRRFPDIINNFSKKIDASGWWESEKEFLYSMACKAPPGIFVEIGASCGHSSMFLAAAAHEKGTKLYTMDPYEMPDERKTHARIGSDLNIPTFHKIMEKLNIPNSWELIHDYSHIVAKRFDKPIAFIFIDGCHCYECVKNDYELWVPKIVTGGILVFHDAGFEGPAKVIKLVENSSMFSDKKIGSSHPASKYTAYFIKINGGDV